VALTFSVKNRQGRLNVLYSYFGCSGRYRGIAEESIIGTSPSSVVAIEQQTFRPNAAFVLFLHRVIAVHGAATPSLTKHAVQMGHGSLPLVDGRARTRSERHEPEDVLGVSR
jgi:hypothetical protein